MSSLFVACPALPLTLQALAYDGPAYRGLDAATFSEEDWAFGAGSVRLLSGLYGVLRPGDLIQPYRLEMGSRWVGRWVGGVSRRATAVCTSV